MDECQHLQERTKPAASQLPLVTAHYVRRRYAVLGGYSSTNGIGRLDLKTWRINVKLFGCPIFGTSPRTCASDGLSGEGSESFLRHVDCGGRGKGGASVVRSSFRCGAESFCDLPHAAHAARFHADWRFAHTSCAQPKGHAKACARKHAAKLDQVFCRQECRLRHTLLRAMNQVGCADTAHGCAL